MKHSKRGAKRNRPETSLIFDERSCSKCDQLSQENSQLKTHTSSLQVTVSETADKANALTKDKANKETTISELKTEINSLKNDHTPNINNDLKKRNEEYELIKQMVVERDKTIKKLQENHKKDIQNLSLEKAALGDELNRVTEENTTLKDKETTLMDVFKYMKVLIDSQDKKTEEAPQVSLNCHECDEVFNSENLLITHMKGPVIPILMYKKSPVINRLRLLQCIYVMNVITPT